MANITLRSVKGTLLTTTEVDNNFNNLNLFKLESSAYTASDVLTKIKTVDGPSSGLDADLLDGYNSATAATASTVAVRGTGGVLDVGTPTLAAHATTKTYVDTLVPNIASNIIGGSAGQMLYQSASGVTSKIPAGTAGQVLKSNATSAPIWSTQIGPSTVGSSGQVLQSNGTSSPQWVDVDGAPSTDDITTNSLHYPAVYTAAGGNIIRTSSTKLTFNPSTGTFSATSFSGVGSTLTQINASNISSGTLALARLPSLPNFATNAITPGQVPGSNNGAAKFLRGDGNWVDVLDDTAYGAGWNNNVTAPSKNAVYDKIELMTTALNSSSLGGTGQSWQNVTAGRSINVTYTNTTGRPIQLHVNVQTAANAWSSVTVDGMLMYNSYTYYWAAYISVDIIIPNGATYRVSAAALHQWFELR